MDLVKARQRAKKKAENKDTGPVGPGPAMGARAPSPAPPAAPPHAPAPAPPVVAEDDYPVRPVTVKPAAAAVEDVFMDTAFGEDLPPLGLDEELPDDADALLGEWAATSPAPAAVTVAEPAPAPKPRKSAAAKPEVKPAPRAEPERKPGPRPEPAPAPPRRPAMLEIEEEIMAPAPRPAAMKSASSGLGGEKKAVRPLWEDSVSDFALGDPKQGDDFFALVSEELYLREFGRPEEDVSQQLELLSFRLAREVYAVRLTSIKQIIKLTPITTVPRAPAYVLGIISLRGTIIPVFDLRRRLELPRAEATRKSRIVVVSEGRFTVGLIVDEVEQVARISAAALEPPPSVLAGVEAEFIEGIGRTADKMIILLALDKILTPVMAGAHAMKAGA
jgi:purine-binding chemotaxis protein CheW